MRGVLVFKATVQTFMAHAAIAVAVAWQLGQRLGNLLSDAVGRARLSSEIFGWQGWA